MQIHTDVVYLCRIPREQIGAFALGYLALILGILLPVGLSNSYSNAASSLSNYYKVAVIDSKDKSEAVSDSPRKGLYDDFEGGTYNLSGGQKSPNGRWVDRYNGFGAIGVRTEIDGNNVLFEDPKPVTFPNATSAGLVVSTINFSNFVLELDMRTDKQLRQNTPAKTFETAWIIWRIADNFHAYYFILKTNGFEFGKKDNNCSCEQQVFLKTGHSPKVELGEWAHVKISSMGKHTTIWVDGVKVVDMDDRTYNKAQMSRGSIGLYNEDSLVAFDNIYIYRQ